MNKITLSKKIELTSKLLQVTLIIGIFSLMFLKFYQYTKTSDLSAKMQAAQYEREDLNLNKLSIEQNILEAKAFNEINKNESVTQMKEVKKPEFFESRSDRLGYIKK